MAPFSNEAVKIVLTDVHKFINVTLKGESLSKKAETERSNVAESLEKLFADSPSLAPSSGDDDSSTSSSQKVPSVDVGGGSRGSAEDDYDDQISPTTVKALEGSIKMGYLDYKKQKESALKFATWEKKRYFVLHNKIMYCFKKPQDQKQTCAFLVTGYEFHESPQHVSKKKEKECCFELTCPGRRSHQFLADSRKDLLEWKEVLEAAVVASTSMENLEDGEDLYEPLPEETNMRQAPQQQISVEISAPNDDEAIDEDEYWDGASEPQPQPSPSPVLAPAETSKAQQPSPKAGGGFFSKLSSLMKKEPAAAEAKEEKPDVKEVGIEEEIPEDDDEIYEPIGDEREQMSGSQGSSQVSPKVPQINVSSSDDKPPALPPAKSPSVSSAIEPPPNSPRLPSRSAHPPPLPKTPIPDLPPREAALPPPLPSREVPTRPPNIPVPPIPTSSNPSSPSNSLKPTLEKRSQWHPRDEDYENLYYGAWPCSAGSELELTFSRGDIIHVISRDLEPFRWWVGELSGKIGLVPKDFLVPAYMEVS